MDRRVEPVRYRIRVARKIVGAVAAVVRDAPGEPEEVIHRTNPFPCVTVVTAHAYEWLRYHLRGGRTR